MIKKIFLLLSTLILLQAEEGYANYEIQKFFDRGDIDTFFTNETGELLKKIMVDGHEYLMQQDGDLYNEDVATIEELTFAAKSLKYSFGRSKRLLATKVYPSNQTAFYSNCDYVINEKKLVPIHESCGFHYRKNENRSKRIEWEHVVPAWHFGHQLQCWQNGGRMNCRQNNTKFRQMEADMHNLVPAIGEINGDRSNYKYAMIAGEERNYGKVNVEIAFSNKKAEPQESIWGDIARTYFYMRDRYGLRISKSQEKMLIAWNNSDPVNEWEKEKNQRVKELQGDENLYITNYSKIDQLGEVTEEAATSFNDVKGELEEEYAFIFGKLSAPLASLLLLLMSLFVYFRRKQTAKENPNPSKQDEQPKNETPTKTKGFMLVSKLGKSAISFNTKDEIIIEKVDKTNPNQIWVFTKANKKREYFFIENLATGKVIEIENSDSNDGAKIILNKKKSRKNDHQEWKLESSKNKGYVFVISKWSLNVLDVKYKKINDGTKVQSFHKKVRGTENQEWSVEKI